MSILATINSGLDFLFSPLFLLPPFWAILILSIIVAYLITLAYKYTTDQDLMKRLKTELKDLQNEVKQLKHAPDQAMKVQSKAMETNMKYMMHSMKSTLYTFIPIILIFSWFNAHYAFLPITPQQEFTIQLTFAQGTIGNITVHDPLQLKIIGDHTRQIFNNQATFTFSGPAGDHLIEFDHDGKTYTKQVRISSKQGDYITPVTLLKDSPITTITTQQQKLIALNLFGWKLGWLGAYIIFSIIFSTLFRKVMNVY